jgi:hypothetical protein
MHETGSLLLMLIGLEGLLEETEKMSIPSAFTFKL